MIHYIHGDLFYSPARVLVNPVNTVGAMGSGIAHDFKRFFPEMYEQYRDLCQRDAFNIGQLLLYRGSHKWVLNFPTKRHFRATATLNHIEDGLKKFVQIYAEQGITSVSFPALGAGDDALDWAEVKPVMEGYLDPLPIAVYVHLHTINTASQRRSIRIMKHWLTQRPAQVTFARFWQELVALAQQPHTAHDFPFKLVATVAQGRQRLSLKLLPRQGETIFLPETQLRDLWQYVVRAGYVLPQNLPAGLETHASMLIALLSELSLFRSIKIEDRNGQIVTGLHYIPPIDATSSDVIVHAS
ncbi:MAG: macro domain-containing protein [Anaerolineae bacterium]